METAILIFWILALVFFALTMLLLILDLPRGVQERKAASEKKHRTAKKAEKEENVVYTPVRVRGSADAKANRRAENTLPEKLPLYALGMVAFGGALAVAVAAFPFLEAASAHHGNGKTKKQRTSMRPLRIRRGNKIG